MCKFLFLVLLVAHEKKLIKSSYEANWKFLGDLFELLGHLRIIVSLVLLVFMTISYRFILKWF